MGNSFTGSKGSKILSFGIAFFATLGLSGCLVAGYSSRGGGFIWPGGLGLLLLALLIFFLMRRR
jgi:hypothetical protein